MKWYKKIRIKKVFNFDGPGLTECEYNSKNLEFLFILYGNIVNMDIIHHVKELY